ncbi:MAG: hypothetical protein Ta2E_03010 [Mycoplasmoidaceae bacterium]|nr:MAG: hypothetical protein Ta2E_03010 [Mycoplasmoidaceae bacterium]
MSLLKFCKMTKIVVNKKYEITVLYICAIMSALLGIGEGIIGWLSKSASLLGDAADSSGDAITYSIAIYAVYKSVNGKDEDRSMWQGVVQLCLASFLLEEVIRRAILQKGDEINVLNMLITTCVSLFTNIVSVVLLCFVRKRDANAGASFIFSSIDLYENLYTLIACLIIWKTKSEIPDIVGGAVFFAVIFISCIGIFRKCVKKGKISKQSNNV